MNKFKPYVIVSFGIISIILAVMLIARFIYFFPYIAVIIGAFVCTIVMLLTACCLTARLAPHYTAEKCLDRLVQTGEEACIAYFDNPKDDREVPNFAFITTIQRHKGLETLEFSSVKPELVIDKVFANCGKEMNVYFYRNGRQYICFIGKLQILHFTEPYVFQITVHTIKLFGKTEISPKRASPFNHFV